MHSRRFRFVALASGMAVFGLLGTAQGANPSSSAGPKTLTVADDAGDARGAQAGTDIKQIVFTTTGKTATKKVRGKMVKSYTADTLVVTMTLAAAPTALPPVVYEVDSVSSTCGGIYLYWDPQEIASGGFVSCGSAPDATGSTSTTLDVVPVVTASTITWTMPLNTLPKEMRIGSSITDIHSYVAVAEPNTGASTALLTPAGDFDDADSGAAYKIG